jgi:hypothetical protein
MDILVQNERSKLFLVANGSWTAKRKHALSFSNSYTALQHCLKNNLRAIVLLFCYRNPALNLTVAPFADQEPLELTAFNTIQDAIYFQAQALELKQENSQLRKELDNLIAGGKERRKGRPFATSFNKLPGSLPKTRA